MSSYEIPQPILNSPYDEPRWHWWIEEGQPCEKREGRRPSVYYYRPPRGATGAEAGSELGTAIEMTLVSLIRQRVKAWREAFVPRTAAWDNLKRELRGVYADSVWDQLAGTVREPFAAGEHRQIAVKVIDDRGNELLVVKSLKEAEEK